MLDLRSNNIKVSNFNITEEDYYDTIKRKEYYSRYVYFEFEYNNMIVYIEILLDYYKINDMIVLDDKFTNIMIILVDNILLYDKYDIWY